MIYVKTGEGGGKTTSAIGLAVRAIGHGKTVYILQFMKKRQTGELILRKFKNCVIRRFGRKEFVNLKKPEQIDKTLAKQGLEYAFSILRKRPFLVILDEINLACSIGLLNVKDVLKLINEARKLGVNLILTGRKAPRELIKTADIVTEYKDIKRVDRPAEEGIEF